MKETTVQKVGHPAMGLQSQSHPIDEKSERASSLWWSISNQQRPQQSAEEHSHATSISVYKYEFKSTNEELLWNASRQAETKTKMLQYNRMKLRSRIRNRYSWRNWRMKLSAKSTCHHYHHRDISISGKMQTSLYR